MTQQRGEPDQMAAHTPLPWELGLQDAWRSFVNGACDCICKCDGLDHEANAAFIIEACNNYDALRLAVRDLAEALGRAEFALAHQVEREPGRSGECKIALPIVRAALTQHATAVMAARRER